MIQFTNDDQYRAFMKKESARLNMSLDNTYHTFIARTLLERISLMDNKKLLVKGSSAEAAYLGKLVRAVTDVDLAGLQRFNLNKDLIKNVLLDNDLYQLSFKLVKDPTITPTGIHKLSYAAVFGKSKQALNVDYEDNYDRLIRRTKQVMPKIFEGDREFEIYCPSFEEYLAEKLCIIVESNKPDVINTRLKDFYDIYCLHGSSGYDAELLTHYFGIMLKKRNKIDIKDATTTHLDDDFIEKHKHLWAPTLEKYDCLDKKTSFERMVFYTQGVLREQLKRNGAIMPFNPNIEEPKQMVKKRTL